MQLLKKYTPEIVLFLTGALIMIFEVVGSRVLGPYFGTSIFVWSSLIGIIMGSLSVGYWLGGKLSIVNMRYNTLLWLLLGASLFVFITAVAHIYLLDRIVKYIPDIQFRIIIATILLFSPASIFFAMVLPYCVKLKIEEIKTSGAVVGKLYSLSTIGSIMGTFFAGFVLVPGFGYTNILYSLSLFLILLSFILLLFDFKLITIIIPGLLLMFVLSIWIFQSKKDLHYIDVDTMYNRVIIYNSTDPANGRPIKMLKVNDERSSAMYTDEDNELVFKVLKYYHLVTHFTPHFTSSLMIGGSGYAFPKVYLTKYTQATMDVVEIDPGLTKLAYEHFNLKDDARLSIYHEDGRTFLNRNKKKYDAIFMDAYKSLISIPFQLTTREAIQKIYDNLNTNGAVYANLISSLDNNTNYFLRAELATYKSVFPQVYLFAVENAKPSKNEKSMFQNIMLVGIKSDVVPDFESQNFELNGYLGNKISIETGNAEILTDEFAPVEYITSKVLH